MGVYRHHDGGITKKDISVCDWLQAEIFLYMELFVFLKLENNKLLKKRLALSYYTAFRLSAARFDFIPAVKFLFLSLFNSPLFLFGYLLSKRD